MITMLNFRVLFRLDKDVEKNRFSIIISYMLLIPTVAIMYKLMIWQMMYECNMYVFYNK